MESQVTPKIQGVPGWTLRLPSVEDCLQRPISTAPTPIIAIAGIDDRNQTESMIAIHRNAQPDVH
jgi:hypothetical protein